MNEREVVLARCPECGSPWEVGQARCWLCYGDMASKSREELVFATVATESDSIREGILRQIAILAAGALVAAIGYGVFALQQVWLCVIYVVAVLPPYLVVLFGSLAALVQGRPWSGKTAAAAGGKTLLAMLSAVAMVVSIVALVFAALFIGLMVICHAGR